MRHARRNPLEFAGYGEHLIWDLMRRCAYVVAGLRRAGLQGGWL